MKIIIKQTRNKTSFLEARESLIYGELNDDNLSILQQRMKIRKFILTQHILQGRWICEFQISNKLLQEQKRNIYNKLQNDKLKITDIKISNNSHFRAEVYKTLHILHILFISERNEFLLSVNLFIYLKNFFP